MKNLILVICSERKFRGGTVYTKNLFDRLKVSSLVSDFSFFALSDSSWKKVFLLGYNLLFSRILILSFPASLPLCFLFFWKKKFCIIHTPFSRLSFHTKLAFVVFKFFLLNSSFIFVACHLLNGYTTSLRRLGQRISTFDSFVLYPTLSSKHKVFAEKSKSFLSVNPTPIILFFTGGTSPEKNLSFVLNLLRIVVQSRSVILHIFGTCTTDVFVPLELRQHVIFHGFTSIPWSYFSSQNALMLMPSHYEGMPLSCLEAMAQSIVTISSSIPAFQEISYFAPSLVIPLTLDLVLWSNIIINFDFNLSDESDPIFYSAETRRQFESFLGALI